MRKKRSEKKEVSPMFHDLVDDLVPIAFIE
jgi:hypothetical protein